MRFVSLLAVLSLLATPSMAQAAGDLRVIVKEGSGAVVPRHGPSARRFAVLITDSAGLAIARAHVRFLLPSDGPSGAFASGLKSETVLTGGDGVATVYGIIWNDIPGPLEITVSATAGNRSAQARIPVVISAETTRTSADRSNPSFRGRSSSKKWLILAAVAAAATAGLASAGRNSSATQVIAPPAAIVVQPSIGSPSITIGKP